METIKLDKEWLLLLKGLQQSGISKEQFKAFLESKNTEKESKQS